jgi:hypothetical protein
MNGFAARNSPYIISQLVLVASVMKTFDETSIVHVVVGMVVGYLDKYENLRITHKWERGGVGDLPT